MSGLEVGTLAPDFTLPGVQRQNRRDFSLSEYRGQPVVLAFYPGDATAGCSLQLRSYRDDFKVFEKAGAVVLAISPQSVDSHADWSDREGFPFALLADTDHKVIESYGARSAVVGVKRTVYIIDSQGIVQWCFTGGVRAIFKKPRHLAKVLKEVS